MLQEFPTCGYGDFAFGAPLIRKFTTNLIQNCPRDLAQDLANKENWKKIWFEGKQFYKRTNKIKTTANQNHCTNRDLVNHECYRNYEHDKKDLSDFKNIFEGIIYPARAM